MNCPKCGKAMVECSKFPGLWRCVDNLKPLNDAPPYRFACTGMELTPEAYQAFEAELQRLADEEWRSAMKLN